MTIRTLAATIMTEALPLEISILRLMMLPHPTDGKPQTQVSA